MLKMTRKWSLALIIFVIGLAAGIILTAQLNITPKSEAENSVPLVTPEGTSPFVKVAKEVMPCVVNISAEKIVEMPGFQFQGPMDEFFRQFFKGFQIPPQKQKQRSLGSGFIFKKKDGYYYILTNNHVVRNADKLIVKLSDKSIYSGDQVEVVGTDEHTDIAVLKVKADHKLPIAKLGDSDSVQVGDWAIAIGNPFGLERTVTVGVISAKGRSGIPLPNGPDYQDFIQTDAAINPGNSGGPLVNIKGEVIGINTAITSPSGGFIGIGFAIPINTAKFVAEQIIEKGKVERGFLGVTIQEVTPDIAEVYKLKEPMGALVSDVKEGYPAAKAGIKAGDIIVKFNGKEIKSVDDLRLMVAMTPPGTKVKVEVVREGGSHKTFTLKLASYPEAGKEGAQSQGKEEEEETETSSSWLGMTVQPNPNGDGVVVTNVKPESDISDKIAVGDIILRIGKYEIKSISDFKKAKKAYKKSDQPVLIRIERNGQRLFVAVKPKSD